MLRNSTVLILGTVVAQLIPILLQPFLRRYFTPESFGAFSVYSSLLGILLVVSSFKYEQAIVLPSKDKDAENVVALSLFIVVAIGITVALVVVFFSDELQGILNISDRYSFLLLLLPIGLLLIGGSQIFNYWLIRKKTFLAISINKLARRGIEAVVQVGFSLLRNAKGLIYADVVGQTGNVVVSIFQSVRAGFNFRNISLTKIKYVAKKYSEFPKYSLIPGLMTTCSFLLPALMINKFYSTEYAGYFDLSKLLLSIPMALIASSVSSVLLQKVSEQYRLNRSCIVDIKYLAFLLCSIAIVEVVVILLFGVELFGFLFGNIWRFSGEISLFLVWSYALNFIASSFSPIFIAMRKIKIYSIWQVFYFISILSLMLFKDVEFINFIKIYVLIEVLCYSIVIVLIIGVIVNYETAIKSAIHPRKYS